MKEKPKDRLYSTYTAWSNSRHEFAPTPTDLQDDIIMASTFGYAAVYVMVLVIRCVLG